MDCEKEGGLRPSPLELTHVKGPTENNPSMGHRWEKSQKPKAEKIKMGESISAAERTRRPEKYPKFTNICVAINCGEQWKIMGKALKV